MARRSPQDKAVPAQTRGGWAEELALRYLKRQGLKPLARNFRCRFGEIDLVMQDADQTVFVEVRQRSNSAYLHPAETIDQRKCQRLIAAARHYLQGQSVQSACRFDVVLINGPQHDARIEWISNAFEA